jgi:hypothetical protein
MTHPDQAAKSLRFAFRTRQDIEYRAAALGQSKKRRPIWSIADWL